MRQCAGTVVYVAPQVLECKYDHQVDLWSCGVLLYILLCGFPPFRGETDAAIMTAIRRGNYSFPSSDWSTISEEAKSLIRSLLKMKVKDRISADDALDHAWIKDPPRDGMLLGKALERIRKFMAVQRQTQDLNPQHEGGEPCGEPELAKCTSQSSIATWVPQGRASPGAWFQQQLAALGAAVGSVMTKSTTKRAQDSSQNSKPEETAEAVQDMSPSQMFRLKHLKEEEREAHEAKMAMQELSPVSLFFRQKHVEEEASPTSPMKQVIEVSPFEPSSPSKVLRSEVSPTPSSPGKVVRSEVSTAEPSFFSPRISPQAAKPEVVPTPIWLQPLPGNSLSYLSSTEKPYVDGDDDLPPPPQESPCDSEPEQEAERAFVGQPLEFFSKSAKRWLPCEVINVRSDLAIMVNVKPNTWLTLEVQRARIRSPQLRKVQDGIPAVHDIDQFATVSSGRLVVGQAVEYLSASAGRWIPCEVTHVDAEHSIQLDVKPGCWIPLRYQKQHIRLASAAQAEKVSSASGYATAESADMELEYYSLKLSAWIPCVVLEKEIATGNIVIDALPYAWITPAQQASYLRTVAPQNLRVPLIGDKVVYFSASHKRWIPSIITDVGDKDEVELEIKPGVWINREAQRKVLRWCASQL